MKLPDFNQHPGFLELRRRMGAKRLGHFVLFDAGKHLSGKERAQLENRGMITSLEELRLLPDYTLAIKNGRVLVYPLESGRHFHLAACPVLLSNSRQPLVATTCLHSPFPFPSPFALKEKEQGQDRDQDQPKRKSLSVCPQCLNVLAYKGFSLTRNRKIRYSEQLLRHFQLPDFFRIYTLYPVRIEGGIKRQLPPL